jgi:hypothetical protein
MGWPVLPEQAKSEKSQGVGGKSSPIRLATKPNNNTQSRLTRNLSHQSFREPFLKERFPPEA